MPGTPAEPAFTDREGRFRFSNLPAGSYYLMARKPGYSRMAGETVTLAPSREDLTMRLEPLAVIKGRVVDSSGEPVPGAMVHAVQPRMEGGRRRMQMRRWARANDRGDYRLWDLQPGRYYVKVAGRSAGTSLMVGELPPAPSDDAFAPIYHGGSRTAASALPVRVAAGTEAQVDFSVELQPGRTIIGAVVNAVPYRSARIELLSGEEDAGSMPAVMNAADGRFRIQGVVDGAYTLRVTQGEGSERTRAVERVEVAGRDVTGLLVRLAPGISVKGTVRVDGALASRGLTFCEVALEPLDTNAMEYAEAARVRVDPDWKFEVPGVLPGRYRVAVHTPLGYTASMTAGDKDLGAGDLTVDPMEAPAPLEVVLRTDGAEVAGSVVIGGRRAASVVVLVPAEGSGRDWLEARASDDGRFTFSKVPPGEYRVYAWKDDKEFEYPDVSALSGGERLPVVPNGKHKLELTAWSEAPR